MLAAHFFDRPAMRKVVHRDLHHPDAGKTAKPSGLAGLLFDVRVPHSDSHLLSEPTL